MKKIYFITPYLSRDLPGNCLVGYYLEKVFGLKVDYLNGYNVFAKIRAGKHIAIIFDHLEWKFKAEQIKYAHDLGLKTIVLPTEGLFADEHTVIRTSGHFNNIKPFVDLQFSWGSFVQEIILKNDILPESKLHLTGSPRFDFYSQKFIDYEESKESFYKSLGLKMGQPLILWATNTVYVGVDHENIRKKYLKNSHNSEQFIEDVLNNEIMQFEDQMKIFRQLIVDRSNWNFVIKVHPAEKVAPYEQLVAEFPDRVFLFYNQSITKFLIHCDLLFQRNCTTANEAWMLNKPVIQTEIRTYPRGGREEFLTANDVVRNYDETLQTIEKYLAGGQIDPEIQKSRDKFISTYFYKIDGNAYLRIGELIGELLNEENLPQAEVDRIIKNIETDTLRFNRKEKMRLPNIVKDLFSIPRNQSLRFWMAKKITGDKTEGEREANTEEIQLLYKKYSAMKLIPEKRMVS